MPDDLVFTSATELARRLRTKEISAGEVMAAHLAQVERVNPKVNAIVTLIAEQALRDAALADEHLAKGGAIGPLHGLPVAHKDLHETKGIRTTLGSPIFANYVPKQDALPVARIRAAGAITIGKTNTPEFGLGSQTFNKVFGATRNPYDLSKTCGGSSGGAAVALATGMVPIADGSDSGGSLRNPASFNNVVGFRTSPGRVPSGVPGWATFGVPGPMARSVEDAALLLSVMAGPDPRTPLSITEAGDQFRGSLASNPRGLRIAWGVDACRLPLDPRARTVCNAARSVFGDLGCETEDAWPDIPGADLAFQVLRAIGLAASPTGALLDEHRALMKETAIWNIERGRTMTGLEAIAGERARAAVFASMATFMERYDALVLPVSQVPPFSIDQEYVTEVDGEKMETYIDWMRSCSFITVTAHPAISVPCGFTPEGLPIGLQIVGRYRGEMDLLRLAHAFEQVTNVGKRRPEIAI